MSRILILNTDFDEGEKDTSLIIKRHFPNSNVEIVRVCENIFPQNLDYEGFIINGSRVSCYEDLEWLRRLEEIIREIRELDKPLLGICFGCQIIATALGGAVVDSGTREFGYRFLSLSEQIRENPIFHGFPEKFLVVESHKDVVSRLPDEAVLLVENDFGVQVFNIGNIYAVQFHPEMDFEYAMDIAERRNDDNSTLLKHKDFDDRTAARIFENFEKIVG